MKALLAIIAAMLCTAVQAELLVLLTYPPGKEKPELHSDAANCTETAKKAVFFNADGSEISGCWIVTEQGIQVVFTNGKADVIPASVFKAKSKFIL